MASGDELAETTAERPVAPRGAEPRAGDVIGRYTIERVLGAGGMGVVFAAHDPDLDRRIALKVLRQAARGRDQSQARARLLREARAMAKLSHPNVITVHEVGTDGDRDFVAMELIDGRNVADWLCERRSRAEVLRVMRAAGRGLAAAHAGGLVHRDFKPHNVLLGRDGRVVVTDFGLARAYEGEATAGAVDAPATPAATGFEETIDAPATAKADASSLSSTLTQTGAMLGTPAYMAPEQFAGGTSGPETDQFAFCVALWEALAGTRPFRGGSIDELRSAVERGAPVGGGEIPRRYRAVLERGLRRDPAARWPSLEALLAALEACDRRPRRIAAALAAGAAIGGAVGLYALGAGDPDARSACEPASSLMATAWTPGRRDALAARFASEPAGWGRVQGSLDRFADTWGDTWDAACRAPDDPRFHGRVACLHGALDELAALVTVLDAAPPEMLLGVPLDQLLKPPGGCLDSSRIGYPPLPADPAIREQVVAMHRDLALARMWARMPGRADAAKQKVSGVVASARDLAAYPAILAEALEAHGTVHHILGDVDTAEQSYVEAARVAERTRHLPVRAMAKLGELEIVATRTSDLGAIRRMADDVIVAIEAAGNDTSLRAGVELELASLAVREGNLDGAIERVAGARGELEKVGDLRRIGMAAAIEAEYRLMRGAAGDDARAIELFTRARDVSRQQLGPDHPRTQALERGLALTLWQTGDLDGAHAIFERLPASAAADPALPRQTFRGRVVDAAGRPVAGARVYAGGALIGDPRRAILPLRRETDVVEAIADAEGRFTVDALPRAIAIAEHGDLRAPAVALGDDEAVLRLGPTGALEGVARIEGGPPAGDDPALAIARRARLVSFAAARFFSIERQHGIVAPVAADGTFALTGVPPGRYHVGAQVQSDLGDLTQQLVPVTIDAGRTARVDLPVSRDGVVLDVIVRADRDATIPSAQVHVVRGRHRARDVGELLDALLAAGGQTIGFALPVDETTRTSAGAPLYAKGDIHAPLTGIRGTVTICVLPFGGDLADLRFLERVSPHADQLDVTCRVHEVPGTPGVQAIVVETPPARRLP